MANNVSALIGIESGYHAVEDIGAMIGEDSEIGDQVAACPGVVIGARCRIASSNRLEGFLPNRSIVV